MKVLSTRVVCDLTETLNVSKRLTIVLLVLITFTAVALAQGTPSPVSISFDFRNGALGWQAGFARYPPATDKNGFYELLAEIRSLPVDLGVNGTGFYIQGNNHSDALVMFMKRGLSAGDGIVAGQTYQVDFTIIFASSVPTGCFGTGGSPGDSVNLRAGASPAEPLPLLAIPLPFRDLGMNVNIGGGSGPNKNGLAASFAGTIANGQPCDLGPHPWVSIQRNHLHTTLVNANSKGEIWLFVGTDSGYEGPTNLYYQRIDVTLTPVNPPPPPVLLTDQNTGRAAAVDSVTLIREPFSVVSLANFSPDQRTRITLFGYDLELKNGEGLSAITAQAEDPQHRIYPLSVEAAREVPDFNWITAVTVKLPDELQGVGDVSVKIGLRGVASNQALISIK